MSEAFLGEIRMFAGNFAPQGWALCNGQILSIAGNEALYTLLGTLYGGDGQNTFALPDLQGRVAVHPSTAYARGQKAGAQEVTLNSNQLPAHTHQVYTASDSSTISSTPTNATWADSPRKIYSTATGVSTVNMNNTAVYSTGGNQPHNNMMPSTVISFIISLEGTFPPRP
ncbi:MULTISPECIES: phage tail protein [unclassified Paenibacillus]|uniref:phage tail protein n=1 Tax=unclassified Paenibacillus TaxID=185978 RepID=UPI0011646D0E|nr:MULTISPECIES: tail fiber protein [unclassified Paenibacillus]AWP28115.1 phage tail protein [Paenibacillus sp. Cedars]MDH6672293.1 microcystin-dependent protein [Paenibacillus sp. LBL]